MDYIYVNGKGETERPDPDTEWHRLGKGLAEARDHGFKFCPEVPGIDPQEGWPKTVSCKSSAECKKCYLAVLAVSPGDDKKTIYPRFVAATGEPKSETYETKINEGIYFCLCYSTYKDFQTACEELLPKLCEYIRTGKWPKEEKKAE